MQRVDPFIPVSKPLQPAKRQPLAGLVNNVPRERSSQHSRASMVSVDGLRPSTLKKRTLIMRSPRMTRERAADVHQLSALPVQHGLAHHAQVQQQSSTEPKRIVRSHRVLKKLQTPMTVLGIVIAGLLLQSAVVGIIFIMVYAIIVFRQRLESRISFGLAFCSLLTVVLLVLFKNGSTLITNFSLYAFVLLVVGAITLGREVQSSRL